MNLKNKFAKLRFIVLHEKEFDGSIIKMLIDKRMKDQEIPTEETLVLLDVTDVAEYVAEDATIYNVVISEYDTRKGTILHVENVAEIKELSTAANVEMHIVTLWPGLNQITEWLGQYTKSVHDRSELDVVLANIIDTMKE